MRLTYTIDPVRMVDVDSHLAESAGHRIDHALLVGAQAFVSR
jgi:hypothetical protein